MNLFFCRVIEVILILRMDNVNVLKDWLFGIFCRKVVWIEGDVLVYCVFEYFVCFSNFFVEVGFLIVDVLLGKDIKVVILFLGLNWLLMRCLLFGNDLFVGWRSVF